MISRHRRQFLGSGAATLAGLAAAPLLGALGGCQQAPVRETSGSRGSVTRLKLTSRVNVIQQAPGNLVALSSSGSIVLVDSGSAEMATAVSASIGAGVSTLFNTHYHADQTGGNALFAKAGATIHAHTITRQWLATDFWVPAEDRWQKAPPAEAVPTATFRDKGEMKAGSERIEFGYLLEAHTRGDIYVLFRDSNVLAAGDVASPQRDPMLDWFAGGWLGGRVDAMDVLLDLANDETRIVPAYGEVMTKAQFQAERDMMLKLYDRTASLTAKGNSAQDMLRLGVVDEVERKFQDPFRFLYDVAKGYQAHYTNVGTNVV